MKYIVTFSGGKDSVATWLYLQRDLGCDVTCVFADTGWESEVTYEYLECLERHHGLPLVRVYPRVRHLWCASATPSSVTLDRIATLLGVSVSEVMDSHLPMAKLIAIKGRPPSPTARFCTTILKLRPLAEYTIQRLPAVVIATGVRSQESEKRALSASLCRDELVGCLRWAPIKHWEHKQVFDIHAKYRIPVNPHYKQGCSRVGCWPCIFAKKSDVAIFAKDTAGVQRLKTVEQDTGQTYFSRGKVPDRYASDIHLKSGKRIATADDVIRWALGAAPAMAKDGLFADEHSEYDAGDDLEAEVCSSLYGLCE